jgi:hypothetical protein
VRQVEQKSRAALPSQRNPPAMALGGIEHDMIHDPRELDIRGPANR